MEFQKENIELNLMNAHLAIENSQAQSALEFLARISPVTLEPGLAAVYYRTLGQATILQKNYVAGIALLEKALEKFEEDPATFPLQTVRVLNWIGIAYYEQGNIGRALNVHYQCLKQVYEEFIEDPRFRLKIYLNLGNDYLLLGQTELSQNFYQQALEEDTDDEDREDLAAVHWGLGLTYRIQSNPLCAYDHLTRSSAIYQNLNQPVQVARVETQLSMALIDLKDFSTATKALQTAFEQATANSVTGGTTGRATDGTTRGGTAGTDVTTLISATTNLALLYRRQEDLERAEEWGAAGLVYAEKLAQHDPMLLAQALTQQAEVKLELGKDGEALELFEQAVATSERTGAVGNTRQILYRYYSALKKMGQLQKAFEILHRAYLTNHNHTDPFNLQPL